VSPGLDRFGRYVKYILLALGLSAFWLTGSTAFVLFTPMDTFFSGKLSGWMLVFAVLVAAASLAHFRFFCRYLCPVGAFFALFNRIAILGRLGPVRRFPHCDLGSRGPFDLDCIRCNRCAARAAEGAGFPSRRPGATQALRDLGFLGLLGASLICAAMAVAERLGEREEAQFAAGGSRKIDGALYQRLIREGVLSEKEALFTRAVQEPEGTPVPARKERP